MSEKPIYGSARQTKWPYQDRIYKIFKEFDRKVASKNIQVGLGNLLAELRIELEKLIDEIYQELAIELKHRLYLSPTRRKYSNVVVPPNMVQSPCQICGESRVINNSHIISKEIGGSNSDDNLISLCANHHHLFDHGMLTQGEFSKINLTGKAADAIEYFKKVRVPKQNMFWKSIGNNSK